jgi:hypothetical protein
MTPPRLADWLLRGLVSGPKTSSLIGDLHEQYQRRRSRAWYWRQVLGTVAGEAWRHKTPMGLIFALGFSLPRIYTFLVWPRVSLPLDRLWYPHMIDSSWGWMVTDPWAYRLQPYLWTGRIVWCAFVAVVAWAIGRWRPTQRGLLLALLLITQVGLNVPYLQVAVITWAHAPENAMWGFGVLWFTAFTFVAIPLSVLLGSGWIPDVGRIRGDRA